MFWFYIFNSFNVVVFKINCVLKLKFLLYNLGFLFDYVLLFIKIKLMFVKYILDKRGNN